MIKKSSFIAIIPARVGSKGIKKKNLIRINGHPLVSYSIVAAKKSKFIREVFVTTDGKDIAKISKEYGAKVILRPKHLSSDTAQIEPAILHAIKYIEKGSKKNVENIVLLQPTSVLRKIDDLDNSIKKFIKDKADSLFSCVDLHTCIWKSKNSKVVPLNFNPLRRQNRQDMTQSLIENGSIYITKKKIYKMKRSRLGGKISKYIMKNYSVFQIDTKEDLKFITTLLKSKIKKKYRIIVPKNKNK